MTGPAPAEPRGRLLAARTGNTLGALLLFVAFSACLAAQKAELDPHTAQPQRPTVATHAGTVARGWLELESGIESDRYDDSTRGALVPVLAKLGLSPRLQLEVQTPAVWAPGEGGAGLGDLSVGIKWRFLENAPTVGDLAILPSIKMPTGSSSLDTGTGTTDVGVLFISSHELGPVAIDVNVGYTRRSGDGTLTPRNAFLWTGSFSGPARGPLGWVAELYSYPATSGPVGDPSIVAFLAGSTLMIRPWLVVDAGVILPITGPQPKAVYAGAVYNVARVWR